jgi:hypothetical protein
MASPNGVEQVARLEEIAAAVLTHPTQKQQAQALSVHQDTLRAWMRMPAVQQAVSEARRELLQGVITALQNSILESITVLQRLMRTSESEWMRHQCAQSLLVSGLRSVEMADTEARMARIEQLLEAYDADIQTTLIEG